MSPIALSLPELQSRIAAVRPRIVELGVRRLAVFGSVRRNEARADSDVDLLVEFVPGAKSFDHLLALGDLLEEALSRRVELVTPESLSPYFRHHILAHALDVVRAA